jgi:hypothetical protein
MATHYPGRNVIIKSPEQLAWGSLELTLDSQTGMQLLNSQGFKKFTLTSTTKIDIIPMIDDKEVG